MTPVRENVLRLLAQMSERYLSGMALGSAGGERRRLGALPAEPHDSGIWEVEDEKILSALERHLAQAMEQVSR